MIEVHRSPQSSCLCSGWSKTTSLNASLITATSQSTVQFVGVGYRPDTSVGLNEMVRSLTECNQRCEDRVKERTQLRILYAVRTH